jgi:hypothetical protein
VKNDALAKEYLAQITNLMRRYASIGTLPEHPKHRKMSALLKIFSGLGRGDI